MVTSCKANHNHLLYWVICALLRNHHRLWTFAGPEKLEIRCYSRFSHFFLIPFHPSKRYIVIWHKIVEEWARWRSLKYGIRPQALISYLSDLQQAHLTWFHIHWRFATKLFLFINKATIICNYRLLTVIIYHYKRQFYRTWPGYALAAIIDQTTGKDVTPKVRRFSKPITLSMKYSNIN